VCVREREKEGRVTLLSADTQKGYSGPVVGLLTAQQVAALFCFSHRDGMLDQEHHAPFFGRHPGTGLFCALGQEFSNFLMPRPDMMTLLKYVYLNV